MGMGRPSYAQGQGSPFGSGFMMQRPMPGGPGKGRPRGGFMQRPMPQNPLGMGGGMGQPMPQNSLGETPRIGGGSLSGSYSPRGGGLQPVPPPMPPMGGGMSGGYRPDLLQNVMPPMGGGLQSMQYPHAIPPMSGGMSDPGRITADGPVPGAPYMQNIMQGMLGNNMRSGSFSGGMFGGGGGSRFDAGGQPMGGGFGMQYGMMGQPIGMGPDVRTFGGGMGGMMGPPSQFMKRMPQAMRRMPMGGFSAGGITDLYPL